MSTSPNPRRQQQLGTYAVQGVASSEEMNRLQIQDRMVTTAMGGVLPEQSSQMFFDSVLDIGCGPGGWLLETARANPGISRLVGVDISEKMIHAARAQAKALGVDNRVEFHQMDALARLKFPDESFDLVNERFAVSWLRTWDWPTFLLQCQRVAKPGGVLRLTEGVALLESTSPALTELGALARKAFHQAGHLFTMHDDGITQDLPRLMSQHGLLDLRVQAHALEYRGGTPQGKLFIEDWIRIYRFLIPFITKWTKLPDNYEDLYQQMVHEIQQPTFVATMRLLTICGTRSPAFSLPSEA